MAKIPRETLIRLYYIEDMSLEAIGKLYDMTRQAVSLQMDREDLPRIKRHRNQYTVKPRISSDGTVGESNT